LFRRMEAGYGLRTRTAQPPSSISAFRSTTKKKQMRESQESKVVIAIVDEDLSVRGVKQRRERACWT
jgi:hypothetical protein